jgi:hypothetical protein
MPATRAQDRHIPIDFVMLISAIKLDVIKINQSNLGLIADTLVVSLLSKRCVSSYVLYHVPNRGP